MLSFLNGETRLHVIVGDPVGQTDIDLIAGGQRAQDGHGRLRLRVRDRLAFGSGAPRCRRRLPLGRARGGVSSLAVNAVDLSLFLFELLQWSDEFLVVAPARNG